MVWETFKQYYIKLGKLKDNKVEIKAWLIWILGTNANTDFM